MITLKISSNIELEPAALPAFLLQKVKQHLTLPNPAFFNAQRLGYYTGNLPQLLYLYEQENGRLTLPRGYGQQLLKLLKQHGTAYQVEDARVTLPPVEFGSRIRLRDYQAPAVEKLLKMRQGGLVAPCGSGKTVMLLEAIARAGQPALWITHTKELLEQARQRAAESLTLEPAEVGTIAGGQVEPGERLTVALIQTLHKANLAELAGSFGCVIVDEGHHSAARTFYETISKFPALYRWWCSATPNRADGLTKLVFAAGGPVQHEISLQDLPIIIPELVIVETGFTGHDENYSKLISQAIGDTQRNRLIVDTIEAEAPGNYSLVLSDRVEHLETLEAMLREALPALRVAVLTGRMSKKERAATMQQAQRQEIDVLLATQLAREGLDLPHLNRLFMATPKRAAGAVQQETGRIMRQAPGKEDAIVFDFVDMESPILRAQFWRRRDAYGQLGMNTGNSCRQAVGSGRG